MQYPLSTLARGLWKPAGLIILLSGGFVATLLIQPGGPAPLTLVDNVLQGVFEAVGLLLALPLWLPAGTQTRGEPTSAETVGQRWVPRLLALALACYVIGQVLWTLNENILRLTVLFPTWADAGYLGSYPFVLLAILLLPTRPLLPVTRLRIVLDGLMILVGLVTLSWYFILGPTILQGSDTLLGELVGAAYPLATVVLLFCLLLLFARVRHDPRLRPVVFILALALIVIITTDSIYDYQELHNAYVTGTCSTWAGRSAICCSAWELVPSSTRHAWAPCCQGRTSDSSERQSLPPNRCGGRYCRMPVCRRSACCCC